jgi:hypothetical protein
MGNVVSTEKKIKRLEKQLKKYKDNPNIAKRLSGKILGLKPKKKTKK